MTRQKPLKNLHRLVSDGIKVCTELFIYYQTVWCVLHSAYSDFMMTMTWEQINHPQRTLALNIFLYMNAVHQTKKKKKRKRNVSCLVYVIHCSHRGFKQQAELTQLRRICRGFSCFLFPSVFSLNLSYVKGTFTTNEQSDRIAILLIRDAPVPLFSVPIWSNTCAEYWFDTNR